MTLSTHSSRTCSVAALALVLACSAQAQSSQSSPTPGASSGSFSLIPYATNGYVGLNVGKPDWDLPCVGLFRCSEGNTSYNLYTGGMFNPYVGAELGYVNFGRFHRAGGRTQAHGLNLSVVGQIPLGGLTLFAKAGAMYGETKVSASPLSGLATGKDRDWERSYGAGAAFNFTTRSAVVLEWNRYDLNFVGSGRQDITTTSLGYVHRF